MKNSLKILLVDDIQDFLDLFAMFFEMDGAETCFARDYNQALEHLESKEFDIVITDYRMPRMHGLYLIEMIKAKNPDMPVILVSAYVDEKFAEIAKETGADEVMKKPFEYDELISNIQKVLKRKERSRGRTK